jgi:hypothetical protein
VAFRGIDAPLDFGLAIVIIEDLSHFVEKVNQQVVAPGEMIVRISRIEFGVKVVVVRFPSLHDSFFCAPLP